MSRKTLIILFSLFCITLLGQPVLALRVVSLLPSNTEILESVGAGGEVVGVTRFDSFVNHPGVANVGDFVQPSMEKIVSLHPDLIVAGYWTSSHIVPQLKKLNYRVIEIRNPGSLDEIYASIRTLAKAVDREQAADLVITSMKFRLDAIRYRARNLHRRWRTYIEIDRPYWTVGNRDFLTDGLAVVGADNIFSYIPRQAAQVSPEIILHHNPQLIISLDAKKSEISQRRGWDQIIAVKEKAILDDLIQDDLVRPSPRLLNGLEALLGRLESMEKHK